MVITDRNSTQKGIDDDDMMAEKIGELIVHDVETQEQRNDAGEEDDYEKDEASPEDLLDGEDPLKGV